ncbi:MAG: CIA30 family protein, partial [Flavobacteriales bacterium]|nr:CIA30 family protein [Flavobacteriales bacterium]
RFDYYSYVYSFPTSGNWESVSVDLTSMYPSFRGQRLNFSNFSAKQIQQISILIANDKEEEFNLIIDEICIQ